MARYVVSTDGVYYSTGVQEGQVALRVNKSCYNERVSLE
jgi:hypothetical protein